MANRTKKYSFKFPLFMSGIFNPGPPFRVYPGAMFPVVPDEIEFLQDVLNHIDEPTVLPPGIPLDLDILEAILQHWLWLEQFKQQVIDETAEERVVEQVADNFAQKLQLLYMEVLWRQIQKKP